MSGRSSIEACAVPLLICLLITVGSMTLMHSSDVGSQGTASGTARESTRAEVLLGFRAVGASLHFRVATGGCTTADDFRLDVEQPKDGAGHVTVVLHRIRADACKGYFPDGTEITFNTDALGISPGRSIMVLNPFSAHGGP